MITSTFAPFQFYDNSGNSVQLQTFFGLSTESKPTTGVGNGSALVEMDTSKIYFYDATGSQWLEWGASATPSASVQSLDSSRSMRSAAPDVPDVPDVPPEDDPELKGLETEEPADDQR